MTDLCYRPLGPQDAPALHQIVSDWNIVRQLGSWPWPPEKAFTDGRSLPFDGDGFVWGIFDNDQLIGTVGVTEGELGFKLRPSAHRRGIMTAAARAAIEHAFDTLDLNKIKARTWFDNAASANLLMKLSFSQLGQRVEPSVARGVPTLCYHFLLTRVHWDDLRSRGEWTIAAAE